MLARIVVTIAALVVIVYGVIAALTPLPAGVLFIVLGLIMIALANPRARPLLKAMRRRWPWFDKMVRVIAERAPDRYQRGLDETEPARPPPEEAEKNDHKGEPSEYDTPAGN